MNRLVSLAWKWVIMVMIIGVYMFMRSIIGWDDSFDWSRFSDFVAFGTLGIAIIAIYSNGRESGLKG
ncbi:hypothetical protein [Corynebacterium sp.]|uniref:hypothetical protein n=1 Tax=Corynebacterium sp. TaxID=1720 RepID=UPI0028A91870|nr:hypothetical protein [Corynebacterium sp.]